MDEKELNIIEHLDELRTRLIITVTAFVLFLGLSFFFVTDIYKFFTRNLDEKLIVLGPSDVVWIYFAIASVVAVACTIPIMSLLSNIT